MPLQLRRYNNTNGMLYLQLRRCNDTNGMLYPQLCREKVEQLVDDCYGFLPSVGRAVILKEKKK